MTAAIIEQVFERISSLQEEITYRSREVRLNMPRQDYEQWLAERERAIQRILSQNGLTQESYERLVGTFR